MPTLTWDEIEPAAARAFSIWNGHPELRWAQEAWQILTEAGLTAYKGELDRHRVIMRFLALGGIYSDWCDAVWDQHSDPWYSYWIEELEISAFRIGQLVGAEDDAADDEIDDGVLVEDALNQLADAARPEVVGVLLERFETSSGLFLSLWRSTEVPDDHEGDARDDDVDDEGWEGDEEEWYETETDDEVLNEVTSEKLRAFTWIEQGCYPYG